MTHHDLYDWLVLAAASGGVLSAAGAAAGFWRKLRTDTRGQAEYVMVWCRQTEDGADEHEYVIRNASDKPVSQLVINFETDAGEVSQAIGVVDRGKDRVIPATQPPVDAFIWPTSVECWFYDASGRRWYRDVYGRLYRWHAWGRLKIRTRERVGRARAAWFRWRLPQAE